MPIRPDLRHFYNTPEYHQARERIVARAKNRCEQFFEDWGIKRVFVDSVELSDDEKRALAWRDGFRSYDEFSAFAEMMVFWEGRLPFEGHIIHWRYTEQKARAAS